MYCSIVDVFNLPCLDVTEGRACSLRTALSSRGAGSGGVLWLQSWVQRCCTKYCG